MARGAQRPRLVLPTGTGNTMVCALLVQRCPGRFLMLAHRDACIQQAVDTLCLVDPTVPLGVVVQATRDAHTAPTVVASVPTLHRHTRLTRSGVRRLLYNSSGEYLSSTRRGATGKHGVRSAHHLRSIGLPRHPRTGAIHGAHRLSQSATERATSDAAHRQKMCYSLGPKVFQIC
jgi:hypothetical protein